MNSILFENHNFSHEFITQNTAQLEMSLFQDKVENLERIVEELKSKDEREDTDEYSPIRMKPIE